MLSPFDLVFLSIKKMKCESYLIQTLVLSNTLLVKYSQAFISPEMQIICLYLWKAYIIGHFPIGDRAKASQSL